MSARSIPENFSAGANLTGNAGYVVKRSGANVILATDGTIAAAEIHVGVVSEQGDAESGDRVSVHINGRCRGRAGGVLTRGTHRWLTTNASGELVAASAGDVIIADWVDDGSESAAADGDWIEILVNIRPYPTGTLGGGTGGVDNVILRADGAGGVTVQGGGVATLSDAGAIAGCTGLTLASGNIVLSGAGATVDGVDLDTAIRGALGATDNILVRTDGAGGVTAQGGSVVTCSDAGVLGAATGLALGAASPDASAILDMVTTSKGLGLPSMSAAQFAAIAAPRDGIMGYQADDDRVAIWGNGARRRIVDDSQIRRVTMSVGAEAANAIDVTLQVVDGAGASVAAATQLDCKCWSPSATTIALTETGAGSAVFTAAAAVAAFIAILTDANGAATLRITFTAAETVYLEITPAPVSGTNTHGVPTARDIAFA